MRPISELRALAEGERKLARRPQVIELCDAVLELTVTRAEKPKTDRNVYMRNYMVEWRKRRKAEKQENA